MTLLVERIKAEVVKRGGQRAVARWLGISAAHVNDMVHGRRGAGPRILAKFGLAKVVRHEVTYVPIKKATPHGAAA